ncbi:MAG: hypothetical protein IID07_12885 [Gemmatimonadetes bacterium]|nr:hypothetical protein [Gemmatimonadota bacterium]
MYKTISTAALAALTILSIGCSLGGDASATNAADTLTRRQKNDIIRTLPVPGARGVGRALDVSDLLQDRADRHDSLTVTLGR